MAKKSQMGRKVEGWKAKAWYRIHVPEIFGKSYIGDTISSDPGTVMGRILQTTLGEIIQDYTKQHIKIRVKVTNVAGDAAYTEFVGHELTRDYMRSMVKRRTSRIDTILPVTTKDGKTLRITMTCLTLTRANLSQVHAIRSAMTRFLQAYAAQREFPAFVKEMVSGEVTRELFKLVKPIYPVRRVELIKSRLEPEGMEKVVAPGQVPPEAPGEKPAAAPEATPGPAAAPAPAPAGEPKPEEKTVAPAPAPSA
ncbi:MAG TPA: 30S ribosomal protein S3ae [Methanomicrobiales archaeon]|nr:30S ribosomal protein S3ae [Methanomicrobiales archaeon]